MKNPPDLLYTENHEWLRVEGDVGTMGITDYAQSQLGDVVYVEVPAAGGQLTAGKAMGTVESVKAVSEIFSPASGQVLETNFDLARAPEILNADPYGNGWLLKMRLADPSETAKLMSADRYEGFISHK
jgi:glycine cleavage system H protein